MKSRLLWVLLHALHAVQASFQIMLFRHSALTVRLERTLLLRLMTILLALRA
jgi:hypothetical protein